MSGKNRHHVPKPLMHALTGAWIVVILFAGIAISTISQ